MILYHFNFVVYRNESRPGPARPPPSYVLVLPIWSCQWRKISFLQKCAEKCLLQFLQKNESSFTEY